ncbi:MAG TPA: hypothetical protein VGY98_08675, partial [Verrucomicrobiae bacterium]|nr:hypothetical protein [Verrucomicrobiae bacterium]
TIGVQFYNDQQTTPVLGAGYYFLVLNPANQTYYRINAQQVLYGNTNIFLNAPPAAVPSYGLLVFCDPTNGWVASTTVSNFLWNSASNINVAGLSFANTNNGGATNAFVLPRWPYPLSGLPPNGTNFPAHFLIFDTNGIPYREGMSNLEANVAYDLGTAMALPYEYEQEFLPWQLYGTNAVSPYTNAFGWKTNFPITAYFQTNISGTNLPTLTDADTIPVNAYQQGAAGTGGPTNTAASLLSIYEYLTNKNTLPPYTIARVQFAGVPDQLSITNMDPVTGIITNVADAVNWSNSPVAVSWAGKAAQIPTVPSVQSNAVFYAVQTNWPTVAFQIYTNLSTALARSMPLTGNGVNPSHTGTLYWLTNFTSVNCDVIQTANATALNTGIYYVQFRTPSATAYYYVTGMAPNTASTFYGWVALAADNPWELPSTNGFAVGCHEAATAWQEPPFMQVLVQPL